jgi:hypothetical protein
MKKFKDLIAEIYENNNNPNAKYDKRSDFQRDQEKHHMLKAQEHEIKSIHHEVRANDLRSAKKTRTPEYKMHVELTNAHYKAMSHHVAAHKGYSQERDDENRWRKKQSEKPDMPADTADHHKQILARKTAEHKASIDKAKEASDHANALSKSHGQDYSKYSHNFSKLRD